MNRAGSQGSAAMGQHIRAAATRRLTFETLQSRELLAGIVPALASRPGAPASLFLDFDGNFERQWGSFNNVSSPAYDTDGNATSFSAAEQAAMREIWSRVAEDYAPFNINVTTVPPRTIADRVAARIVIGGSAADWYGKSAGGVSYAGGFAGPASNVGYVFARTLGLNTRYIAEAASHEAGHLFGLEHQASYSGNRLVTEYNAGNSAVAPIMGIGYYADRTLWTRGPTADGPTAIQDDLAVIASSANGFGYAADDYGSTITTASMLPLAGTSASLQGIIGKSGDRDVFKFTTGGGSVNFSLAVATHGANLDGVLELQNAVGTTIASASPSSSPGGALAKTLAAGTYYVVVRAGSGYGNLGQYTLTGNVSGARASGGSAPVPPPDLPEGEDTTPPPVVPPSNQAVRVVDDGASGYSRAGAWQIVASAGYSGDTSWASARSGASATWTFAGLAPGQYRLAGTWSGSRLNATDAPVTVTSDGKTLASLRINQQRSSSTYTSGGASWQNLGTFTVSGNSLVVRLGTATSGRVQADAMRLERVYPTSAAALPARAALPLEDLESQLALTANRDPAKRAPATTTLSPAAVDQLFASGW